MAMQNVTIQHILQVMVSQFQHLIKKIFDNINLLQKETNYLPHY